LEELDLSLNEITPIGVKNLAEVLPFSKIKVLNLSKNLLGDECLIILADKAQNYGASSLEKLDVSSSRVSDQGILFFLERIQCFPELRNLKCCDNFVSEKIEKILIEILEKNKNLVEFSLQGNRVSLCTLNRIKRILLRNK
jgi:Ran GTPase-activating protein (RanGAP) involved in mRNA processing and transport